jgi:hypothetical protein
MDVTRQEIEIKCTSEEIAEKNYHIIASKVNVGRVKTNLVPIADIQAYLQAQGVWWGIKEVAALPDHVAKAEASAILDVAIARYNNLDTSLPIVGQMLGGLVDKGVLTQTHFDYITTMGTSPDPVRWEQCYAVMEGVI